MVENSNFFETSYLLLHGKLPTKKQYTMHVNNIKNNFMIHEKILDFYKGFKYDAHPMAIMVGVVGALSAFYHNKINVIDKKFIDKDFDTVLNSYTPLKFINWAKIRKMQRWRY